MSNVHGDAVWCPRCIYLHENSSTPSFSPWTPNRGMQINAWNRSARFFGFSHVQWRHRGHAMTSPWTWQWRHRGHTMTSPWTYNDVTVNIQWRHREHTMIHCEHTMTSPWTYNDVTVNIQWRHREHTMTSPWTYNDVTVNIQWRHREHTMTSPWTYNDVTVNIQWRHREHTMTSPWTCNDVTVDMQCRHRGHAMTSPWTCIISLHRFSCNGSMKNGITWTLDIETVATNYYLLNLSLPETCESVRSKLFVIDICALLAVFLWL